MPIDSYNERFLQNAPVPTTGSRGGSTPPSPGGRATGHPPIQSSDGLANLRANPQTLASNANGRSLAIKQLRSLMTLITEGIER